MNFQHEQKLSMEELMAKNRPEQTNPPIPEPTSTPQPVIIQCALPELVERLENLEQICSAQSQYLKLLSEVRNSYPTRTQMEELLKSVQHLEAMVEQVGKKNEKRFSMPRVRLPRLYLLEWDWITVLTVVWVLAALFLLWFSSVDGWSKLSLMLR